MFFLRLVPYQAWYRKLKSGLQKKTEIVFDTTST